MAFSIAPISDGSNGCATMRLGSGIERLATWLSGMRRAVRVHVHGVEHADRRAAGAHVGQVAPHALDAGVHPCLDFREEALEVVDVHRVSSRRGTGRDQAETVDPIGSPSTARRRLPGVRRLNTRMGRRLSMQREIAVASITCSRRSSTCR